MIKIFKRIKGKINKKKLTCKELKNSEYCLNEIDDKKLKEISFFAREIFEVKYKNNSKKILYLPSYYQSIFTRALDATFILSLQIRGAEIIPVLTNLFFKNEDVIYGGIFGNNNRFDNIFNYSNIENNLLTNLLNTSPISLSAFSSIEDDKEAELIAKNAKFDNVIFNDIDISEMAKKAVANMNNFPAMPMEKKYIDQYYWHIYNIVRLYKSYEKIINTIKPDTIVSNCPFYYKWQIPFHLAKKNKIPFYSYMLGERENTVFWSLDSLKLFDSSECWQSFKNSGLINNYKNLVEDSIIKRKNGKISHINFAPKQNKNTDTVKSIRDKINNKPSILFPSNILVDAVALQKSKSFNSCLEMIEETVNFFKNNPEFVCILKAHPGEKIFMKSGLNTTSLHLKNALIENKIHLPENVIFIDYYEEISSFDLYPLISGMATYSSSTAMEISWYGKNIITAHSSHYNVSEISYVPKNKNDYLFKLKEILTNNKINFDQIENGKTYYLLYYYFGLIDFKLIQGNDIDTIPTKLLYNRIEDLMTGKNKMLDYICNSILNHEPIFGENKWPPISV